MTSNASGVSASLAAPMSTIQCSFSMIWVLGADLFEDPVEETVADLHDVVFGEAGDLLSVVAQRVLEGVANDLFTARPGDQLQALSDLGGLLVLDSRVKVLFVLPDDDEIHARVLGFDKRRVRDAGSDVGVQTQRLARRDVQALVAAALRRRDRGLEKHPRSPQGIPGRRLDARRDASPIDLFADLDDLRLDARPGTLQDFQGRGHDLRADAVTIGDSDRNVLAHAVAPFPPLGSGGIIGAAIRRRPMGRPGGSTAAV